MAYKFQLGTARMSGALEQEGNVTVATGSNDVIGVEPVFGSGQFMAKMKYDGIIDAGLIELVSGSSLTTFYAGEKLSGSVMDVLAGPGLHFAQAHGIMSVDIDGLNAGSSLHQTEDHFMFSDNGTEKKISFSDLEDAIFANVSGDGTIAAGGALTIGDGKISPAKFADVLGNTVIVRNSSTSGDISAKVVNSTQILIGNGNGFTAASLSGDVNMTNAGAVTIQPAAVEHGMLNDNIISGQDELALNGMVAADELMISDGGTVKRIGVDNFATDLLGLLSTGSVSVSADHIAFLDGGATGDAKTLSLANLATAQAGTGISSSNGQFTTDATQTGISSLRHDSLKIGRASSHDVIDFGTEDEINFFVNGSGASNLEMKVTDGSVTIYGDLNVQGSTTTIDTQNLLVEDSLIEIARGNAGSRASNAGAGLFISGSAPAKDVTFTVLSDGGRLVSSQGIGVADTKGYFVDTSEVLNETTLGSTVLASSLTSVGALAAGSIASGFTKINVADVIDIESIDIDGAADISADLVGTDLIIVDDGAGGTNRKSEISRVAKFVGDNLALNVTPFGDANANLQIGVNYASANPSTDRTLTLPASSDMSDGQSVKVKAAEDMSGGNLIIARNGSQTIDGETQIVLESPFAAVELVYVDTDTWRVF